MIVGMNQMTRIADFRRDSIVDFCRDSGVPGYVAGISRAGEQTVFAHGTANLTTGAPMRDDTGFLFGSITKVMTATLVMRQAELGRISLDDRVTDLLPGFRLTTPGAAERIRVRHLLNHTSGIDAELFFPRTSYLERLGRDCGSLFPAGEHLSYSNGGMIVAGHLLEAVTGRAYHELLDTEIFQPAGMTAAGTGAEQAILRSTAIGHFPDPDTGQARPTRMFMLPPTWAAAGGTPIGTVEDLLAFGRAHLGAGLLSGESLAAMREINADPGTPGASPTGLGWLLRPIGDTIALTMTGASPGGVAVLAVLPEHDLVFAAYGNDPRALELHDDLLGRLAGDTGRPVWARQETDPAPYAGTYRSDQLRIDVRAVGGELEEQITYEPADPDQERILTGLAGGPFTAPPTRYVPVGAGLFAPAGLPLDGLPAHYLVSYHDGAAYRCAGGRMARRVLE